MENNDWQRIENIFHRARELPSREARAAYLARACAGDERLRGEVESLLKAFERDAAFMDEPVFGDGLKVLHSRRAAEKSLVGKTIGSYTIKRKLGEGGMGSVYLAEDERLDRAVALKFLTGDFAADDNAAKKQLVREARALAVLDHRNICVVHGVEEIGEHRFIVMQYVKGETLAARIRRDAIGDGDIVPLARQIAEALAAAHAFGIVHRDVKPANVLAGEDGGQIKVVDFGLAQTILQDRKQQPATLADGKAMRASLPLDASQNSQIIGTISYMSPERLRGERADAAGDIFSFGVLLYELASGRNPFERESGEQTVSAILNDAPAPLKFVSPRKSVPPRLERIVNKCLEKDPRERYQSMNEILLDLDALADKNKSGDYFAYLKKFWLIPVLALLIISAAVGYFRAGKPERIAILPIVNRGADAAFDYVGDGLTESLIDRISRLSNLPVKPYASVAGVERDNKDYAQIARRLAVNKVLTTVIIARDGKTYLQSSLISAEDGASVWTDETPISLDNSLAAEESVARKVISEMEFLENESVKKQDARGGATKNQEAFNYYLYGRYYWAKRNKENVGKAVEAFSKAVDIDPTFAPAYAGLANAYVVQSGVAYGSVATADAMPKARFAAKQAMEIDDSLAESHAALAVVTGKYYWDWAAAESEFKRAVELNPEYAQAHYWYSELLSTAGRTDEALAEAKRARELDPFSPQTDMNVGRVLYLGRRYDDALLYLNQTLEKTPSNGKAKYLIGLIYVQKGMLREAINIFEHLYASEERSLTAAAYGYALGKAGRRAEAAKILASMNDAVDNKTPPQEKAIVLIGLGDKRAALGWLERAFEERLPSLSSLKSEPLFDDLRAEPKFKDLLARMNFR